MNPFIVEYQDISWRLLSWPEPAAPGWLPDGVLHGLTADQGGCSVRCGKLLFFMVVWIASVPGRGAEEQDAYTLEAFQAAAAELTVEADYSALCQEYVARAQDLNVVRSVQDRWQEVDPEGALAYFRTQRKRDPESARAVYLLGRVVADPLERIELGRRAIAIDPNFSFGYRLVLGTYVEQLFQAGASAEIQALLQDELPRDEPLFTKLVHLQPDEAYALDYLFDYQDYRGDNEAALQTLDRAKELEAAWARGTTYAYIYAKLGRYDDAHQAIADQIADMVTEGQLTEDESSEYLALYYDYYLRKARAYAGLIEHYQRQPDFGENPSALFAIGTLYHLEGNDEMALGYLEQAAAKGFDSAESLENDDDLKNLHGDPRWLALLQRVRANWEAGTQKRRSTALAAKVDKPAPDWTLKDPAGKEVALASLRGEILILDFWATWCNPCRKAMPVLSDWLRHEAPAGVRVFSINVWEPTPLMAKKYMVDNDYAMTLLYGNDDLVQAYGIQGIPYICAIDAEGNIRFEEKGYEEGLREKLRWWVEDLQQIGKLN